MDDMTDIFGSAGNDTVEILPDAAPAPSAEKNARKSAGKDFSKKFKPLSEADAQSVSGGGDDELASSIAYRQKAARKKRLVVTIVLCACLLLCGCAGGYAAAVHFTKQQLLATTPTEWRDPSERADVSFSREVGTTAPGQVFSVPDGIAAPAVSTSAASDRSAPTTTAHVSVAPGVSGSVLTTTPIVLPDLPELSDLSELAELTVPTRPQETPAVSAPASIANTDAPPQTRLDKKDIYSANVASVVGITATISIENSRLTQNYVSESKGSGFIVSSAGVILTNYHIVKNSTNIELSLYDGSKRAARLVGYDDQNDLAVLQADVTGFKAVKTGSSARLAVGDEILIIGHPLGTLEYSLTNGVVSATDRLIATDAGALRMFQTNAPVNQGNSGGPVFNMNGEVVGIVTGKYSESSIEGLSFCVPLDNVIQSILEIVKYGSPQGRPMLSASVQTLAKQTIEQFGLVEGAYIVELDADGAAAKAGLQKQDVITEFNGKPVASVADLRTILLECKAGQQIPLKVFRDGAYLDAVLTADEKVPRGSRTGFGNVYDL